MGSVRSAVVPHKPRRTAIGGADPRGGLLGDELCSFVFAHSQSRGTPDLPVTGSALRPSSHRCHDGLGLRANLQKSGFKA